MAVLDPAFVPDRRMLRTSAGLKNELAMASGVPGRDHRVVAARQKADVGWHSRFLEPTVSQSVVGAHATIQLP